MFSEFDEGLSEDQKKRLENLLLKILFEEKDILEVISTQFWKKHWKEVVVEKEKYSVGQLKLHFEAIFS